MAEKGKAKKYLDKFKFTVEIDGFAEAGFMKCDGLKANIEKIEHREGGALVAEKAPGLVSYDDITLERGATDNLDMWDWFKKVYDADSDQGGADPSDYERNIIIHEHDRAHKIVRSWAVNRCWPVSFQPGTWDNSANEHTVEQLVLSVGSFEPLK